MILSALALTNTRLRIAAPFIDRTLKAPKNDMLLILKNSLVNLHKLHLLPIPAFTNQTSIPKTNNITYITQIKSIRAEYLDHILCLTIWLQGKHRPTHT